MASALIVIDMLNTYDHEDGERLAENARDVVPCISQAIDAARDADDHVIYVNDHFGMWSGQRTGLIEHVLDQAPDRELIEPILPADGDPFLLKARHSIFYETSLAYLLRHELEVDRLTLVGQVTEQCILYSALDAYVDHFALRIPTDAVVPIDRELADAALRMIESNMSGELVRVADLAAA